jgi:ketosteroid isomerase-like protein
MSEENVEITLRGIDAVNRGDLNDWLTGYAPEAEWHTTGRFADQGVYRGRAGLERLWAELHEDFEELSVSVSDVRAIGDRVFVAGTVRGIGKRSKAPFEEPNWFVTTFRDGLVARVETYVDPAQALEAAGLEE